MNDARYFHERASHFAAAALEASDRWYAERLAELAAHFAALAVAATRQAPPPLASPGGPSCRAV